MRKRRCLNCVDCTITCALWYSFVCGAWEFDRFFLVGKSRFGGFRKLWASHPIYQ